MNTGRMATLLLASAPDPDPDDPAAVQLFVNATLTGETLRLLVDTGGASCSLSARHTSHLDSIGPDDGWGVTGTVTDDDIVIVPSLSLGPIVTRNVRASRIPLNDRRPPHLGMNVLGKYRCHFKCTSSAIEINEPAPPNQASFPLTLLPGGQPVLPVSFGENAATALWDTGAGMTVVDESFAQDNPHLFDVTGQTEGLDSSGTGFVCQMATMTECTIGGLVFEPSPCAMLDLSPVNDALEVPIDLAVGAPLIVQADWLFDFPARTWAVTSS